MSDRTGQSSGPAELTVYFRCAEDFDETMTLFVPLGLRGELSLTMGGPR
jgi:hypothetical protein